MSESQNEKLSALKTKIGYTTTITFLINSVISFGIYLRIDMLGNSKNWEIEKWFLISFFVGTLISQTFMGLHSIGKIILLEEDNVSHDGAEKSLGGCMVFTVLAFLMIYSNHKPVDYYSMGLLVISSNLIAFQFFFFEKLEKKAFLSYYGKGGLRNKVEQKYREDPEIRKVQNQAKKVHESVIEEFDRLDELQQKDAKAIRDAVDDAINKLRENSPYTVSEERKRNRGRG